MQSIAKPFVVLKHAVGTIQPDDTQQERLEEFTKRITSGEFHKETEGRIVSRCVDGRPGAVGVLMPNAAGGSETIMIADDLTSKSFQLDFSDSTLDQYKASLAYLHAASLPIGGHTCDVVAEGISGCAANDLISSVYSFIANHGDVIRDVVESFGYMVDDATHMLITRNAAERDNFASGADLLRELRKHDEATVDVLTGLHREVAAILNTRFGTTLDREAVRREFGDNYQAFNVDVWAFPETAKQISHFGGVTEAARKNIAMVYYNLAVKHVIAGKKLRIVVVK